VHSGKIRRSLLHDNETGGSSFGQAATKLPHRLLSLSLLMTGYVSGIRHDVRTQGFTKYKQIKQSRLISEVTE
jgi:hypothetical protein